MRKISPLLFALGLSIILSGCSSQSKPAKDFGISISSAASIQCADLVVVEKINCSFPIEIVSKADTPRTLAGNFYALVNGKIYLADNSLQGETQSISDTWNPGELKTAVVAFNVPPKSYFSSIFLGPEGITSYDNALLSVEVGVTAIDNWDQTLEKQLSSTKKLSDLIKRLNSSTSYSWDDPIIYDEAGKFNNLATISGVSSPSGVGTIAKDGIRVPQCIGEIYSDTKGPVFTETIYRDHMKMYIDQESGLGLTLTLNDRGTESIATGIEKYPTHALADKYCESIMVSVPGVKELP